MWVHGEPLDPYALHRAGLHSWGHWLKSAARAAGLDRVLGSHLFTPRMHDLEALPAPQARPRVLFLAEAWDPAQALTDASAQERVATNDMRAACMRGLKQTLGAEATCGFRATPFAKAAFPNLVVSDARLASKPNYLALVREHPICIASHGLHQSTGWKFAEYLSMSRAIVAEPLQTKLPGSIQPGVNYLEFASAAQCVEQVERFMAQPLLRAKMMLANRIYYLSQLRPCALVSQAIKKVLVCSALPQYK
jgi:hypothetical protein